MTCQQCGGFIPEQNKAYGYGGQICHCPKHVHPVNPFTGHSPNAFVSYEQRMEGRLIRIESMLEALLARRSESANDERGSK